MLPDLNPRYLINWCLTIALVAIVAACGGTDNTSTAGETTTAQPQLLAQATKATITISPQNPSVKTGNSITLTALKTTNGKTAPASNVQWSSSNTSVATVNSQGVVQGISAGAANITAKSGGLTGSTTVTVTPAEVLDANFVPVMPSAGWGVDEIRTDPSYATGQSFTVINSGTLTRIEIFGFKCLDTLNGDIVLSIRQGEDNANPVVATATIPAASVVYSNPCQTNPGWMSATLQTPISVQQGTVLSIWALHVDDPNNTNSYQWVISNGNPYAAGNRVFINNGAPTIIDTSQDYGFKTYVIPSSP